jgi:hypothetical protein
MVDGIMPTGALRAAAFRGVRRMRRTLCAIPQDICAQRMESHG